MYWDFELPLWSWGDKKKGRKLQKKYETEKNKRISGNGMRSQDLEVNKKNGHMCSLNPNPSLPVPRCADDFSD